jgi:mono/diheme cytochrome c family protein
MTRHLDLRSLVGVFGLALAACGGTPVGASSPQLQIVTTSGAPLAAVAGDAIALKVVLVAPDGTMGDLPGDAKVMWTAPYPVVTLPPNSIAASPLPVAGADPTGAWIENTYRPDRASDLANVVFVLDPGTAQDVVLEVSAKVSGLPLDGGAGITANIAVDPTPVGDWTRGATLYGPAGANCAQCHGATGHGTPAPGTDGTYTIAGASYAFPAPGINAEPGNCASDPAWDAALFAVASRADMDNAGVALRLPMPDWLSAPNPATGAPLATQDLADIYAFLKTQTQ